MGSKMCGLYSGQSTYYNESNAFFFCVYVCVPENPFHFHQNHSKRQISFIFWLRERERKKRLKRKLPGITCKKKHTQYFDEILWFLERKIFILQAVFFLFFFLFVLPKGDPLLWHSFCSLLSFIIILSILSFEYDLVVTLMRPPRAHSAHMHEETQQ